jgi:hypothetical protein
MNLFLATTLKRSKIKLLKINGKNIHFHAKNSMISWLTISKRKKNQIIIIIKKINFLQHRK